MVKEKKTTETKPPKAAKKTAAETSAETGEPRQRRAAAAPLEEKKKKTKEVSEAPAKSTPAAVEKPAKSPAVPAKAKRAPAAARSQEPQALEAAVVPEPKPKARKKTADEEAKLAPAAPPAEPVKESLITKPKAPPAAQKSAATAPSETAAPKVTASKTAPPTPKAPEPPVPPTPVPSRPAQVESRPVKAPEAETRPAREKVRINESVTVKELAEKMNVKVPDMIKKLMSLGKMANINQRLDSDTAALVAEAFNFDLEVVPLYADEALNVPDEEGELSSRPPVVTVMGHVDHGKTSLLDAIRETRVAEREAGGITQHIGAYQVQTAKGGTIAFLDTPGHEAFTAMRARGAQATDLVVLVVAADDGVMPQTVEALDHARAAGVPIVVAINKCDLPTANPQKIKQELANLNLVPEEWGGKTVMVEVSARQKMNIDKLLEMILLEAELLELKANPNRPAQGTVVEARLDPKRGPVATLLVQKGTLRVGDAFVCGVTAGKIRALVDDRGHRLKEAPPSWPVEILGLSGTPQTGDKLVVVASEREAREIADRRRNIAAGEAQMRRQHLTLEDLHDQVAAGKIKSLPIVLKADVQGSLEAVRDSLEKLPTEEITLRIIHAGVGGITNSDVILADASDAVILGFNVRPDPGSEELARREGVEVKTYRIIYEMINDVKAALEGLLEPEEQELTIGWADVRKVFRTPKVPAIAGCYVTSGKVMRSAKVRLIRDGAIIFDGAVDSLKRFKDDVREVEKGFECGISLAGFQDIKPADRFEFYIIEKKARRL